MTPAFIVLLLKGAVVTLTVSALALVFAMIVGVLIGCVATSGSFIARTIASLYVEAIRSIPLLIIVFFIYYGLPVALDIDLSPYNAATISLTVYGGAYMVEAVRSGILSVGANQWAAARALGLRYASTMIYVVAPQAARVVLPATVGIFNDLIKGSAVMSMIGFIELIQTAVNIRGSLYTIEPIIWAGAMYFGICFGVSCGAGSIQKAFAIA